MRTKAPDLNLLEGSKLAAVTRLRLSGPVCLGAVSSELDQWLLIICHYDFIRAAQERCLGGLRQGILRLEFGMDAELELILTVLKVLPC